MKKKTLLIFGVIVAIIVGVALLQNSTKQPDSYDDSAGLVIGKNAIYVAEQVPSQTVSVAVVQLEKSGFVVVHEDTAHAPGQILGTSGLLKSGETKNLPLISLVRSTKDGETLHIMLHVDDGDGVFDATKDKPALDSTAGRPITMIVVVSKDASEPGAINL